MDCPQANQYAKYNRKTPFVVYQGAWSLLERSFERDIIPMARSLGLALAPFGTLGSGKFRTDEEEERRRVTGEKGRDFRGQGWERTEDEKKICKALEKVAKEVGTKHITAGELYLFLSFIPKEVLVLNPSLFSCPRISFAENTFCVPNCRRPKSRASQSQPRRLVNHSLT